MKHKKDKINIKFDKCLVIERVPSHEPKKRLAISPTFKPRVVLIPMEMYEQEKNNLFTAIVGGNFTPVQDHEQELVDGDVIYDDIHTLEEQYFVGTLFKNAQGQWQRSQYKQCGILHVWANTDMINNLIQRLPVKAISSHVHTAYVKEVFEQLPLF